MGSFPIPKWLEKQKQNRRRNSGHRRKYYQDSGANSKPPENDLTKAPVEPAPVLIDKELREAALEKQKLVLSTSSGFLEKEQGLQGTDHQYGGSGEGSIDGKRNPSRVRY